LGGRPDPGLVQASASSVPAGLGVPRSPPLAWSCECWLLQDRECVSWRARGSPLAFDELSLADPIGSERFAPHLTTRAMPWGHARSSRQTEWRKPDTPSPTPQTRYTTPPTQYPSRNA
jgi:hypothetical protein